MIPGRDEAYPDTSLRDEVLEALISRLKNRDLEAIRILVDKLPEIVRELLWLRSREEVAQIGLAFLHEGQALPPAEIHVIRAAYPQEYPECPYCKAPRGLRCRRPGSVRGVCQNPHAARVAARRELPTPFQHISKEIQGDT